MKIERYMIEIVKGKRKGTLASVLCALLWVLSWPYLLYVKLHNWAFDNEWFKQYNPPIPVVISVGNIVAGGTGKTPVTMLLASEFYEDSIVGILSRGYRSPAEKLPSPIVLSAGKGPLHSAAYCGDEPYLIAENFPKAHIFVGKNRQKTANLAAKAGVELVILDDGMQHRWIGRDYEVVVIDADDPFGQNYHLPRGFLRENPQSLSRASLIIINHIDDEMKFDACKKMVAHYSEAPIVGTRLVIDNCYDLQQKEIVGLKDKKALVFCGIGQPERFLETVKTCGVQIVGQEFFPDHTSYDAEQIMQLANKYRARGAEILICTEKDKVKIPYIPGLSIPIVWLKMKMKIVQNSEAWSEFIKQLKMDLANRTTKGTNLSDV